ncbi:hypothetical protein EBZ39_05535 [bacterium]|nr:hypothetical protein [bacterium]
MNFENLLATAIQNCYFVSQSASTTTAGGQLFNANGFPVTLGLNVAIAASGGTPVTVVPTTVGPNATGGIINFPVPVWMGICDPNSTAYTAALLVADMGTNPTRYISVPAGSYKIGGVFGNAGGI